MLIYNLTAEQMCLYEVLKYIEDVITYAAQSITAITQALSFIVCFLLLHMELNSCLWELSSAWVGLQRGILQKLLDPYHQRHE